MQDTITSLHSKLDNSPEPIKETKRVTYINSNLMSKRTSNAQSSSTIYEDML